MELKHALKQRALDIGFDLVGIAPAAPGRDLEFAREWLARGYGGEMHYLANPQRFDPRAVLPAVKSVVCVGLIYDTPFPYSTEVGRGRESEVRSHESEEMEGRASIPQFPVPSDDGGQDGLAPRGWISRYAWGRDYHEILREKLEQLRAAIAELAPGAETRVFVDTGPVVERAFARFSGLGWMGKNTCVINEEKGSWFFLGVILTSLALDPDLPAPDRCGTCRACLDACPTGALVEPYVMDASRCISYLTIEVRGAIPRDLRPGVGRNIFGCDICQDVCPWNGKHRSQESEVRSQESGFAPMLIAKQKLETGNWKMETGEAKVGRHQPAAVSSQLPAGGRASSIENPKSQIQSPPPSPQPPEPSTVSLFNPPLEALASLTEDDFRKLFAHSPIKRAKYRGWLRNLCVAMGNSGDPRFVPRLQKLAQHADPIVREHAVWALGRLGES